MVVRFNNASEHWAAGLSPKKTQKRARIGTLSQTRKI